MVRQIVWTKRASLNFTLVINYIEQHWGDNVTKNFIIRTFKIIDLLSEYPYLGSLEKEEIRFFLIIKHNK